MSANYLVLHRVPRAAISSAFSLGRNEEIPLPVINEKLKVLDAAATWVRLEFSLHRLQLAAVLCSHWCNLEDDEDDESNCDSTTTQDAASKSSAVTHWLGQCSNVEMSGLLQGSLMNSIESMAVLARPLLPFFLQNFPGALGETMTAQSDQLELMLEDSIFTLRENPLSATSSARKILREHKFGTTLGILATLLKDWRNEIIGTALGKKWQLSTENFKNRQFNISQEKDLCMWKELTTCFEELNQITDDLISHTRDLQMWDELTTQLEALNQITGTL